MQNQALYACSFDQRGDKMCAPTSALAYSLRNSRSYIGNNKGVITIVETSTLNVRPFFVRVPSRNPP